MIHLQIPVIKRGIFKTHMFFLEDVDSLLTQFEKPMPHSYTGIPIYEYLYYILSGIYNDSPKTLSFLKKQYASVTNLDEKKVILKAFEYNYSHLPLRPLLILLRERIKERKPFSFLFKT